MLYREEEKFADKLEFLVEFTAGLSTQQEK